MHLKCVSAVSVHNYVLCAALAACGPADLLPLESHAISVVHAVSDIAARRVLRSAMKVELNSPSARRVLRSKATPRNRRGFSVVGPPSAMTSHLNCAHYSLSTQLGSKSHYTVIFYLVVAGLGELLSRFLEKALYKFS